MSTLWSGTAPLPSPLALAISATVAHTTTVSISWARSPPCRRSARGAVPISFVESAKMLQPAHLMQLVYMYMFAVCIVRPCAFHAVLHEAPASWWAAKLTGSDECALSLTSKRNPRVTPSQRQALALDREP